jgi:lipoprotein signal peptidase
MATRDASPAARNRLLCIVVPVLLLGVVADQASKSWATHHAPRPRILVPGYLAAYAVPNPGIMLGLGRDRALTGATVALLGVVCTLLLVRVAHADRGRSPGADYLAVALLLAGILGNTADRLALGHVRDFLVTWALPTLAFNVADLLLVVGVASLLMAACRGRRRDRPDLGFAG